MRWWCNFRLILVWGLCTGMLAATGTVGQATTLPLATVSVTAAPIDFDIDGNVRLDRSVVPTRYTLDLSIDPNQERFSGRVTIRVDIKEPTGLVRLHAQDLRFHEVSVERDGSLHAVSVLVGKNGGLALRIDPPLPVGPASVQFSYDAPFSPTLFGLYRIQAQGRWHAFTQFQSLYARRAFPCFDQPEFKTPYTVTLRVPRGQTAFANGPQSRQHEANEADEADTGSAVFTFAETKPLPTYLVAFGVGDFDVVAVPGEAADAVPLRVVTQKGRGRLAAFAVRHTPVILNWLATYFGQAYPFAKLDQIAIPHARSVAMENAGLVTYREPYLLLDEAKAPIWNIRRNQLVMAHELAHMWFGNLVTMPWWDELWLNEAFARWMAWKVIADIDPRLDVPLEALSRIQRVMELDSKRAARAIRQPIRHAGDIFNVFNSITYTKGAAILHMLEAWIGEDAFRAGVRAYMRQHAYGTGTTADLLAALNKASGKPVTDMAERFLNQPGTPLVEVKLVCEPEGSSPARLALSQRRYRAAGSEVAEGQAWTLPVCVRYGFAPEEGGEEDDLDGRANAARECFILDAPDKTVALSEPGCPAWLHPNADERGYYRWQLSPAALSDLVHRYRSQLSVIEQVALPAQLLALVQADAVPVQTYVDALSELSHKQAAPKQSAHEQHGKVIEQVISGLRYLYNTAVDKDLAGPFAAYTRRLLAPHLDRIGIEPRTNGAIEDRLLRQTLVSALADMGQAESLHERAKAVTAQFFKKPSSVSTETLALFLPLAAQHGDAALWSQLVVNIFKTPRPSVRNILVRGLGSFEDVRLIQRSLDLVRDRQLRTQDFRTLIRALNPTARPVAWVWLTQHYAQIVTHIGQARAARLPSLASGFCSWQAHAAVKDFFEAHKRVPIGTAQNVSLALEDIERCIRQRGIIREPLRQYLALSD